MGKQLLVIASIGLSPAVHKDVILRAVQEGGGVVQSLHISLNL